MSKEAAYHVHIRFDEEAAIWYVAKSDIPGLRLEADTPEEMLRRIGDAAPELIELNAQRVEAKSVPALRWKPVFDSSVELQHA